MDHHPRRVVAKVEVMEVGLNRRFVVTKSWTRFEVYLASAPTLVRQPSEK